MRWGEAMDREKVIKAFEICDNNDDGIVCKNCPYKEDKWNGAWEDETGKTCFQTLHADVLALLKEQEAIEPIMKLEGRNKYWSYYVCPACDNDLTFGQNYCSECGQAVKWK